MRFACIVSLSLTLCLLDHKLPGAEVIAVSGAPFGVARVTVPLTEMRRDDPATLVTRTNGFRIDGANGRIFYPVFAEQRVLGVLRELLGGPPLELPGNVTAFFLFRGHEPFQITLRTPYPQTFNVVPTNQPRRWQRLLRNWWSQYSAVAHLQESEGDYPPMVETYLTEMLKQRLQLPRQAGNNRRTEHKSTPQKSLLLVFNVESLRTQTMQETLAGHVDLGLADRPIPANITWPPRTALPAPGDVQVEPLAEHVPDDCFYVRFGSFDNYLWLKRFLEQNGGDVGQLATMRGHDALLSQRTQEQLGLKETALSKILGGQVISDIAIIGHDAYLREGASIGVLFAARNGLLAGELMKQRREAAAAAKDNGATMTEVEIGDHKVSFASTPDNRLRSFQVADENYLLVTTSRHLAERFLQLSERGDSLAKTDEFRLARFNYPVDANAAVFAYLSPAFFRGLVSPQYQIELRRRLRAVTNLELVQLAALAARHEGAPHETVDALIAGGFLPTHFTRRADGGHIVWPPDTQRDPADSIRGARGSFLPIADVPLQGVTASEEREYAEIAEFHRSHWTQMDPLVLQMRREAIDDSGRTRIEIDAEMLPFDRQKYGVVTSIIGPATPTYVQQSPNDAIAVQVVLQGGTLRPGVAPHHMFFGIQDREIPITFSPASFLRVLQVLRTAPAYLGAWPKLGLLDMIPLGQFPAPDASGISRLPFGLFRQQTPDGFSLIGFDPQVLDTAARDLSMAEAESPAQIRIHIADVTQSRIKTWFAALDFQRAYQTSIGNTHLLNAMQQQFGLAPDEALATAESILGVELVCALGGEYKLTELPMLDQPFWASTHWPEMRSDPSDPGQFAAPIMAWFRGLNAEVSLLEDRVTGRATLEVQEAADGKPELPFFNLFK
ncbi:MAG: hypothetical protein KDB23_24455 [Planctomycetales bacterium]|nr:hypothetical protein [Planctomycetales bacterium]